MARLLTLSESRDDFKSLYSERKRLHLVEKDKWDFGFYKEVNFEGLELYIFWDLLKFSRQLWNSHHVQKMIWKKSDYFFLLLQKIIFEVELHWKIVRKPKNNFL